MNERETEIVNKIAKDAQDYIDSSKRVIAEATEAVRDAKRLIEKQDARIRRMRMMLKNIANSEQADPVSRALAMTSLKNDDKAAGE